jgi:subtilisin-like proprotein convertase family protein
MAWRPLLRRTRFLTVLAFLGLASAGTPVRSATFANPGQIGIPLVGPANPYPSTITVSNLSGEIVSVTVTLLELIHPNPDDLDIALVGPNGRSVMLMSDAGGSSPVNGVVATFSDAATVFVPDGGRLVNGTYLPSNYGTGDPFPPPGPPTPFNNSFGVYTGSNPNGPWRLFVTDDQATNGGTIGGGWRLTINTTNFPPVILKDPQDQTVPIGGTATFHVDVGGTSPFGYQWLHNGTVFIPFGQGSDTLTISGVGPADVGDYVVVVTNATGAAGAAVSRPARLNLEGPLTIVAITPPVTASPGDNVTLRVVATGTGPILYQWTLNGARIPGATNSILDLGKVELENGGDYEVVVWNDTEALVSPVVPVRVLLATAIRPSDSFADRPRIQLPQGAVQGNTKDFRLDPGERPLQGGGKSAWIEWFAAADGVVTFSTRGSSFDTLLAVFTGSSLAELRMLTMDDDSGPSYSSKLSFNARAGMAYEILADGFGVGGTGGDLTLTWELIREAPAVPVILDAPTSQAVPVGSPATFRIATASANDTFQWFRNGIPLRGETRNLLTIPEAKSIHVGVYRVGIINALGQVLFSPPFELQIGAPGLKLVQDKFEAMLMSGSPGAGFLSIGLGNIFYNEVPTDAERSSGDPTPCGSPFFGTLWQGLTATNNGTIQVDTTGSGVPARMAVYRLTGSPSDFFNPPLICDLTSASNGIPAVAKFTATQGTNYTIVIEGVGAGNLTVTSKMGVAPALSYSLKYCLVATNGGIVLSMPATNWCPLPSCQWRCNGTNIPNATNASLLVTNFQADRIGTYSVAISNFVSSTTVAVAYLDLAGPFTLGHAWVGGGLTLGFKLFASNAAPFILETTTNLNSPWSPVATNPDPCAILFFTNGSPWLDAQRFFRASPWSPP